MPARQTAAEPSAPAVDRTEMLLQHVVRALDDKKASDLRVLRVSEQSSITDYLVLATGNAEPHLRALRVELEKVLDGDGAKIAGMETGEGSGWLVVDAYQIMIHLFMPQQRETYRLEQLWKDATEVDVQALLAPPPLPTKKKTARKAAAPKKKTTAKKKPAAKKKRPS
jgi:ribosome-associated protein